MSHHKSGKNSASHQNEAEPHTLKVNIRVDEAPTAGGRTPEAETALKKELAGEIENGPAARLRKALKLPEVQAAEAVGEYLIAAGVAFATHHLKLPFEAMLGSAGTTKTLTTYLKQKGEQLVERRADKEAARITEEFEQSHQSAAALPAPATPAKAEAASDVTRVGHDHPQTHRRRGSPRP